MSRDYGRIRTAFWNSRDIRGLSDQAKLLASYLITGPHSNIIGAYLLPDAYVTDDMEWDSEKVSKAFEGLFRNGFATRFKDRRYICICNYLVHNPIENPNVGKAALKQVDQLPDDPALEHVVNGLALYEKHLGNGLERVRERLSKPFRNMEPSPSPEPDPVQEPVPEPSVPRADARRARKPKISLPDNFPNEDQQRLAQKFWTEKGRLDLSHSVRDEAEQFRDHHSRLDNRFADWPASWRYWQREAMKRTPKERADGRQKGKSLDATWDGIGQFVGEDREAAGSDSYRAAQPSAASVAPRALTSSPNGAADHESGTGASPGPSGSGVRLAVIERGGDADEIPTFLLRARPSA